MSKPTYISGLLFTKAHKLVRGRIYGLLEVHQLNPTLWSILSAAAQSPDGIRSSAMAELLGVKPPLVTMLGDELIAMGLIKRVTHHTDGRVKLLFATPKGKKLAGEIENTLSGEIGYLMSGLTDAEIATFSKVLSVIIRHAE